MLTAEQLHAAGIPVFPCTTDKKPAVNRGEDWRSRAAQPPANSHWPSGVIGVPVPIGVTVIDLDTYKGITRQDAEQALGCAIPWDAAQIQTTQSGGEHYAFSTAHIAWDPRQGSNIGVTGLDIRVGGEGYICTGEGYTPVGIPNLYGLAFPATLPPLPDACRGLLEKVQRTVERTPLPEGDPNIESIRGVLSHLDPGCGRDEWVKYGMALRHQFHADEPAGLALFDQWSSGELWEGDGPANYIAETIEGQWASFKPEGGVTMGTLIRAAKAGGWQPRNAFDSALAFQKPEAAQGNVDAFNALLTRINESGTDPRQVESLLREIQAAPCNPIQREILNDQIEQALRSEKMPKKRIDKMFAAVDSAHTDYDAYGKKESENADLFLRRKYPDGFLVRVDENWIAYGPDLNMGVWAPLSDGNLKNELFTDMKPHGLQSSTLNGTYSLLCVSCFREDLKLGAALSHLWFYRNGVLDTGTCVLLEHSPSYFTTTVHPYNHNPAAECKEWVDFLNSGFREDLRQTDLLQEWFGYLMSSSYEHHKIMFLLGPTRSGKGVIGKVLKALVGKENHAGGKLSNFALDSFLCKLMTKPVVFLGDAEKNVGRWDRDKVTTNLKMISSGDEVSFDRKYKSAVSTVLPSRITIASNCIPNLFDDSGAFANRMMFLVREESHLGKEDIGLAERLKTQIEGIAAWALRGYIRLVRQGRFTETSVSIREKANLLESTSPISTFVTETFDLGDPGSVTSVGELYDAYLAWCADSREAPKMEPKTLTRAVGDVVRGKSCSYSVHRNPRFDGPVRGFKGMTLRTGAPATTTAQAFTPKIVK